MADLKKLFNKRTAIKGILTRHYTFISDINNQQKLYEIKSRHKNFEKLLDDYMEIQVEIETLQDEESDAIETENFERKYYETSAMYLEFLNITTNNTSDMNTNIPSINPIKQVPIPQLIIPNYCGEIREWNNFKNLFLSVIDKNSTLSKIEKFYYLKSYLKGEAASLISSLPIKEDNYEIAWMTLEKRYENKMLTVNHYLKILNYNTITRDNIKDFLSKLQQSLDALNAMQVDITEVILIYLITHKMDNSLRMAWELSRQTTEIPKLMDLMDFLNYRSVAFENVKDKNTHAYNTTPHSHIKKTSQLSTSPASETCPLCDKNHNLQGCRNYLSMTPRQRSDYVKSNKLCYNCLYPFQIPHKCTKVTCKFCQKRHHHTLHMNMHHRAGTSTQGEINPVTLSTNEPRINETETPTPHAAALVARPTQYAGTVLLGTAIVNLRSRNGNWINARVLLDSGSEVNFVTKHLTDKLQSTLIPNHCVVQGIGSLPKTTHYYSTLKIFSTTSDVTYRLNCNITERITVPLPHMDINIARWNISTEFTLADPQFFIRNDIDILIGAELFFHIVNGETISLGSRRPSMIKSTLGWLISGPVEFRGDNNTVVSLCSYNDICCKDLLTKFWEQEEIRDPLPVVTTSQQKCEDIYVSTTVRDSVGRFIVNLPVDEQKLQGIGNSFNVAYKFLLALESRFNKLPNLKRQYKEFINEYIELGHAYIIPNFRYNENEIACYLPHHAVIRAEAISTKLRVVFNASAKTSSGLSLNDIQYDCPDIHTDIVDILLRIRLLKYFFCCDIVKMFRQININKLQTSLQRILWRDNPTEGLKCIELTTVTYGTKSAPYLAFRTLIELARREGDSFPLASPAIFHNTYMDDICYGANTLEECKEVISQLQSLLRRGGFQLHKWSGNHIEIYNHIKSLHNDNSPSSNTLFTDKENINILGVTWNKNSDEFILNIPINTLRVYTKRSILAFVAKIYDPMGILGPVVIRVPLASHMGGIYEAGIKAAKNLMKRQLGNTRLPYEELNTIVIQIEGILNSRPLCAMSDLPNDMTCLTPAHFLIGNSLMDIPEPNTMHIQHNRLSLFQRITVLKQQFWRQWKLQYLAELQSRPKWMNVRKNIQKGDLVIVKDEDTPPSVWSLGRVINIYPNQDDDLVRVSQKKGDICFGYFVNGTTLKGSGGMSFGSLASANLVAIEHFSGHDCALCVREFYKNGYTEDYNLPLRLALVDFEKTGQDMGGTAVPPAVPDLL
ncbi:uncharacterized protein LOC128200486 [Galleria mellonella]|uniref:Uncharacterized protein LOC128200486 n=1 Tax=Galleria mellonella TaxID=7137 RepID=A0ABM3MFV4_GALME|nr:uncharacterized protein LOC128200486 [Galleria mellonella]